MPIKVLMPALSPTMTSGNIAKWVKNEGDKIKPGDIIAEIETDKATMEVEAYDEGVLAKLLVSAGTKDVAVGSLIAVILEEGEDQNAINEIKIENKASGDKVQKDLEKSSDEGSEENYIKQNKQHKIQDASDTALSSNSDKRIFASPLAKRIASEKGMNLSSIQGSGPYGRIVKADVINYQPENLGGVLVRNPKEYNLEPHTNMRRIIAKRLVESKQNVPHFYLNIECVLDKLIEARADINEMHENSKHSKISVNDLIIRASAMALKDVPHANASWSDDGIMFYNNVDVAVAVAIDGGLITPVIRNADQKRLLSLSSEMKVLAQKAREGKLKPEEFQGGSFTISNLGMYGITRFSAIINPPQSCILAVGEGVKRAVVENDQIIIRTIMDVTLSCDHRVVDGAVGAQFLKAFKGYIEKPAKMLL